jgi:hypothetical protein
MPLFGQLFFGRFPPVKFLAAAVVVAAFASVERRNPRRENKDETRQHTTDTRKVGRIDYYIALHVENATCSLVNI